MAINKEEYHQENMDLLRRYMPHEGAVVVDAGTGIYDYIHRVASEFSECQFTCIEKKLVTATYLLMMHFDEPHNPLKGRGFIVEVNRKDRVKFERLVGAQDPDFVELLVGDAKGIWQRTLRDIPFKTLLDQFKEAKSVDLKPQSGETKRRELVESAPKNVKWVAQRIPPIPVPDESVDLLTDFGMCLDLEGGLLTPFYNEVRRVLKVGGTFITVLPKTMYAKGKKPTREFLERVGYDIIEVKKYPFTNKLDSYVCTCTERVKRIDFQIPKIPPGVLTFAALGI